MEAKQFGERTVYNFTVAVNDSYKKGDEWVEKTHFIDCKFWSNSDYYGTFTRGQNVSVEGKLEQESWEKDGEKRSKLIVSVNKLKLIKMLQPAYSGEPEAAGQEDDLPF